MLELRWPHEIDWCCSYAVLHERRGDAKRAAKYWRLAVSLARTRPDLANQPGLEVLAARADSLDPPAPTVEP